MKNLTLLALGFLAACRLTAADFYVSPQGNDSNAGTSNSPFATVAKARDAVRALKSNGGLPSGGVTVWLRSGFYAQSDTLAFDARDSGTLSSPVVYAAAAGEQVHLTGARSLDPAWFSLVTSSSNIWTRLDASARGKVYAVNLFAHGISDLGTLKARGFVLRETAPLELFLNGQPMALGRWPNRGAALAQTAGAPAWNQIVYSGTRPERWTQASDLWMHGLWSQTWADYHVSVANIDTTSKTISFGVGPAQYGTAANRPYYAYNLLEEIDEPGEYYVDHSTGMLYVWPTVSLSSADILVSMLEGSVLKFSGAQFVTFRGVVIEASRGPLVTVDSGDHVRIESSTLRNAGQFAAQILGTNNGLDQCEIADCGEEGVRLSGGDRASLTSANNYVSNTHIQRTAATAWTYKPGINFEGGCGNIASHNFLESMPHTGILFSGNNHLIESNEIARVCQSTSDAGAIYSGHDWGYRGNIIRANFIHHIATNLEGYGAHGVYLDDCVSGVEVSGNVFYRVSNTAIFCGGGRDNLMRNNLIALSGTAHHNDDRGRFQITDGAGDYWNLRERLTYDGIHYQDAPWSVAYPALAAIPNSWDQIQQGLWRNPQNSVFSDNAGWGNDNWTLEQNSSGTGVFSVYAAMTNNNPSVAALFDDAASLDRTARVATLTAPISGFQPIAFAAIGPATVMVQQAPLAPVLDGSASSSFTIDLRWTAATNVPVALPLGFSLEQRLDSGAWQAMQNLGSQVTVASLAALTPGTSYSFRLRAFNSIGSAYSNILTVSTSAVPAAASGVVRVEAETPLTIVSDVGSNGSVGISDGTLDSGQSVRLYDAGDAVRLAVPVSTSGSYRIGIRVRSGGTTGATSLWPDGYRFKLDGVVFAAVGDATTVSVLDPAYGGCYWGTMFSAPVTLSAGVHTVEVAAASNWAIVDFLELAPATSSTPTAPQTVLPTITVPSDLTINATSATGAIVTFSTSAQDGTGKALSTTSTPSSGSVFTVGTTTVTVSARDDAGTTATKTFSVTVNAYVPAVDASWTSSDVGVVNLAGTATGSNGAFTVAGAGADIWDSVIGFHYLYRTISGDSSVVARISNLQASDGWAKAGLMIRASLDPAAAFAGFYLTPGNGLAFQWRSAAGWSCSSKEIAGAAPVWLRLDRVGGNVTAFKSSDGANWQQFASAPVTLSAGIYVGLAVTSHNSGTLATATFDSVRADAAGSTPLTVTTPPTITVPADLIVDSTSLLGASVNFSPSALDSAGHALTTASTPASGSTFGVGTTTVTVSATDDTGNRSSKTFAVTVRPWVPLVILDLIPPVITVPASITVTAPDASGAVVTFNVTASDVGSGLASTSVSPVSGSQFPVGITSVTATATDLAGNVSTKTFTVTVLASLLVAPTALTATPSSAAVQLTWNSSSSATGYDLKRSTVDGGPYTIIASNLTTTNFSDTAVSNNVAYFYVVAAKSGASSSGNSNQATATLPTSNDLVWTGSDVGNVNLSGHSAATGNVFTVSGSGADIWDSVVGFRYVYRSLTGDGSIVARVTSLQTSEGWAKAGVMMRETLDAGAPFAGLYLTPGNGVALQWRPATWWSCSSRESSGSAPVWLRLDRVGNTFSAFKSSDGVNWQQFASAVIAMNAKIYLGLAVTSHNASTLATATFDSVRAEDSSAVANSVASTGALVPGLATRFEAEASLTVLNDVNSNGTVGISDGTLDSGRSVRLYDARDAIRVFFSAPIAGMYRIAVRVRSGGTTGSTVLWPSGYRFKLDGNDVALTGDPATLSSFDPAYGGCYWGTMTSETISLGSGSHTIDITATSDWAVADYVELIPMLPSLSLLDEAIRHFRSLVKL